MEKYNIAGAILLGGSCWVYKAYNLETNETVAVKRSYFLSGREGVPSDVVKEISLLKEMEHSNILRLLDVVNEEIIVYLVWEYMDLDLKKFMDNSPEIAKKPQVIKRFLHQLLSGLDYCHSHDILHRDLTPQSLLIDCNKNILKLADFGSAKIYTEVDKVATKGYKAPELILGEGNHSTPVDMWSVGCIFAEMVIQQPLFLAPTDFHQLIKIFSIMGKPNEETWPEVTSLCESLGAFANNEPKNLAEVVPGLEPAGIDLLSKMLCLNPSGRITASEALMHPYFDDVEIR